MSLRQVLILALLGAGFWVLAALAVRQAGPMVLDGDVANALLFVGFIPVAWILVFVTGRFSNLDQKHLVGGIAVMVTTALLLDGGFLTWWPDFYGHSLVIQERAAAALLWGAGMTLTAAVVMSRP